MSKGPDAFRTISEVAEELDIPQHVLRFWETRFPSIRPLKRGGGRRYYRPDDVDLLKGIRQLLYGQGYTIKGVQRILKEAGPRFVQGVGRGEAGPLPVPGPDQDAGDEDGAPDTALPAGILGDDDLRGAGEAPYPGGFAMSAGRGHPAAGPTPRDRELLRAVLDELLECERALDGVRRR